MILKEKREEIDVLDLEFDRNLETVLISGLDKILNKNKMSLLSLKTVKITGQIKKDSLSFQITESFKKALNSWGLLFVSIGDKQEILRQEEGLHWIKNIIFFSNKPLYLR